MSTPDLTRLLTGFQGRLVLNPTAFVLPRPSGNSLGISFGAGVCTPGQHYVIFTYVYGTAGESPYPSASALSAVSAFSATLSTVGFANVPAAVTAINVYAGVSGGLSTGPFYFLGSTVPGGGTVTFNVSDAGLVAATIFGGTGAVQSFAPFPYGGTQFGEVMDLVVTPRRRAKEITAEEYGPETIEVVDAGESWKVTAALRGVDPDLYSRAMAVATTTGAPSGYPLYSYPAAATQAGAFLTQRANMPFTMLLVPTDTTRLPSFMFFAVIPKLDESARLTLQLDREGTFGAVFHCLRNASAHVVSWGMLEDLATS